MTPAAPRPDTAPAARGDLPAVAPGALAVIVVNYGTAGLALAGVQSVLERTHGGRPVEVHLVDNASPGDDAEALRRTHADRGWADRVTLWLETENHGFGRGNNVVIDALLARPQPPEFIFLLNPDAALENEALDILARHMEADGTIGAVGAGIALPSGTPVTAAFRFPSVTSEFVGAANFGPLARLFDGHRVALPPDQPKGPVDWVAGAAVMFRAQVLHQVGAFDPDFFLYYEEVELMNRIRRAGHRIDYVPEARVLHAEGAATQVRSGETRRKRRPGYWYDSWRLYHLKVRGRGAALGAACAWMAGATIDLAVSALTGRAPKAPLQVHGDVLRRVIRPLLSGRRAS